MNAKTLARSPKAGLSYPGLRINTKHHFCVTIKFHGIIWNIELASSFFIKMADLFALQLQLGICSNTSAQEQFYDIR